MVAHDGLWRLAPRKNLATHICQRTTGDLSPDHRHTHPYITTAQNPNCHRDNSSHFFKATKTTTNPLQTKEKITIQDLASKTLLWSPAKNGLPDVLPTRLALPN